MATADGQSTNRTKISDDERAQIVERLKERGAPRPCEVCGFSEWELSPFLVTVTPVVRSAANTSMDFGGPLHTSAALLCGRCGNTKLLNLGLLGMDDNLPQSDRFRF